MNLYRNQRICVACSGGGDSVALLHYLRENGAAYGISLSAVHCEHGIRGEESLSDARFVERLCAEWDIPLFSYAEDCPSFARAQKMGLEEGARVFRYRCFAEILEKGMADLIATAHHMDDEAETVLFRLGRGCALNGVVGIRERKGYVRPLLSVSKREISDYLEEHSLAFCTDGTNEDRTYARSAIRRDVLPVLESILPGATGNIVRFASLAREDDELLYRLAKPLLIPLDSGHGYAVLCSEEKPIFTRACLVALKELGVERDYTQTHLNGLFALQKGHGGEKMSLPQGVTGVFEYDRVVLYRESEESEAEEKEIPFSVGEFSLGAVSFSVGRTDGRGAGHGYFDFKKIPSTAVFRRRKEGDVFHRVGGGRKKLKEYLIDRKIPARQRAEMVFLADGKEILAVVGGEISERIKVEEMSDVGRISVLKPVN